MVSNTSPASAPVAALAISNIADMKSAGYQQAVSDDNGETIARWVMSQVAGFPDADLPDNVLDGLKSGYAMRFHEAHKTLRGEKVYAVVGGQYILESDLPKGAKPTDSVRLSLHVALAYSNHDFGRLHETRDANFKALVKEYRDKFSTYSSTKVTRLTTLAKRLKREDSGEKNTRAPNKAFPDWWKGQLEAGETRLKSAVSNKNMTDADLKRYREAVAAFNAVWLK
jgi:hypothetical protein